MKHTLIYVLYDGMSNSVFTGQVLSPLQEKLRAGTYHKIIIISFEKQSYSPEHITQFVPATPGLQTFVFKKLPFLGTLSLYPAIFQLRKFLHTQPNHDLIARGPLAGFICKKSLQPSTTSLTIQARGLLAAEYEILCSAAQNSLKRWLHATRKKQFLNLEKKTYCAAPLVKIEAVSTALKDHLVEIFKVETNAISIAHQDIPVHIQPALLTSWRAEIRTLLGIPTNAKVYCYNGSIKPWQCPDKVIEFFNRELAKDINAFLLVLTQDQAAFEHELKKRGTAQTTYTVCTVPHNLIYHYLAACDVGLIFRQPHIVNWTSRPTKVLEYQAAGLPIVHNGTVAWIAQLPNTTEVVV